MRDERDSVESIYTDRRDRPLDVTVRTDVSTEELRDLLEWNTEFFHFIGHVDHDGFRCGDGWLDASGLDGVGPDAFLLNSCRSYAQGEQLVRNGSIAGIVTLTDLLNHRAADIGQTMAQFLNAGFPLYAALDVVRESYQFGESYALLGDSRLVLSQATTTGPEYLNLISSSTDHLRVTHQAFQSHWVGLGAELSPPYEDGNRHYMVGGQVATVELNTGELEELLDLPMPLRDGDDLRFTLPSNVAGPI